MDAGEVDGRLQEEDQGEKERIEDPADQEHRIGSDASPGAGEPEDGEDGKASAGERGEGTDGPGARRRLPSGGDRGDGPQGGSAGDPEDVGIRERISEDRLEGGPGRGQRRAGQGPEKD